MDFFAAGGFQQLFSDLNDTQLHEHDQWVDLRAEIDGTAQSFPGYDYCAQLPIGSTNPLVQLTTADDPFVLDATANEQTFLELQADWNDMSTVTSYSSVNDNNNNISSQYIEGHVISEDELQFTLDHLLSSSPTVAQEVDSHNDYTAALSQCAPAESDHYNYNNLDSPSSVDSTTTVDELETSAFITREMAEWEEKFLDNYIEIPELIDFLPEKTPLCTETCEHFLHESSKNLKLHRKVRTGKRSSESTACSEQRTAAGYLCTFGTCEKIYAKPAHLKAHLRRHMGEKPYTCDWPECTWKFSRSDELARHRRSHSGVKPYECSYCMKCFARSDHLTKHRKVHERRLLAASKAGKAFDGLLPHSVLTVRPGRKRKNQL